MNPKYYDPFPLTNLPISDPLETPSPEESTIYDETKHEDDFNSLPDSYWSPNAKSIMFTYTNKESEICDASIESTNLHSKDNAA